MVQAGGHRRPWAEAASSVFAVASALPPIMNSEQIADLFEKIESGVAIEPFPQLLADIKRNAVTLTRLAICEDTGETFLIVAARANNAHAVRCLSVDQDVLDETDNEGWSALLNAAHKGHFDVVKILLEAGASVDLPDMAKTIAGKAQFFWSAYARNFEIIPQQLCYNAGIDATDILNKLRHRHLIGEVWAGVDIHTEEVGDNLAACIWEPSLVKKNAIIAATEAVCLVLSIDQTVKNVRTPSGGQMPGLPGMQ